VPLALSRPRKGEGRGQVNVGSRSTLARTLWRPLSLPNVCGATHDMPFIPPIIYKITPWHTKVRVVGGGTKAKRPPTIQKSQIAPSFYFFPCIFVAFSAWRLATALPDIFDHARRGYALAAPIAPLLLPTLRCLGANGACTSWEGKAETGKTRAVTQFRATSGQQAP
jgi:hypothetical protein